MALTRRSFIASSAAFAAAGCASIGDAGGAADAPRFEFGKDGAFTFLQLTDLHLKPNGRALHPRVERVLRAAFAKHAPSLLVLTGDNVNGQEGDVNVHGIFVDAPPCADPKAKEGPETGYSMDWPDGARRMLLAPGAAGALKEHTCPPLWKTYRDAAHTVDGRTLYDS